jgi:hypothetical protein
MHSMNPNLQIFIDRVIVPALVDRFLREQTAASAGAPAPIRPAA